VIPIVWVVRKPEQPDRLLEFPPLARLLPLGAHPGSGHVRRADRAAVHRLMFGAVRAASIPWVVVRTFLRRA
jgi:hypothetical protein